MREDPPVFRHSSHPTALGETFRILPTCEHAKFNLNTLPV